MRRKLFSVIAGIALLTGAAINCNAGTVTVKGDTQATIYGGIEFYSSWASGKTDFLNGNVARKGDSAKTQYSSYMGDTYLGIKFDNKDANLSGVVEGDFDTEGNGFELNYAYVRHNFNNGLFVLIGQDDQIGEQNTYSINYNAPAGFNGTDQVPQVKVGKTFDLGFMTLKPELAFEDVRDVFEGGDNDLTVSRIAMPGVGLKVSGYFETGFGRPTRVYAFTEFQPLELENPNGGETSKNPYVVGGGVNVPVYFAELQSEFIYGDGTTNYAGVETVNGLKVPGGYYVKDGSIKSQEFYTYNVEGKVRLLDYLEVYGGYDYLKFENDVDKLGDGFIDNTQTIFAGANVFTTKYTTLSLEWSYYDTEYYVHSGDKTSDDANELTLRYVYRF